MRGQLPVLALVLVACSGRHAPLAAPGADRDRRCRGAARCRRRGSRDVAGRGWTGRSTRASTSSPTPAEGSSPPPRSRPSSTSLRRHGCWACSTVRACFRSSRCRRPRTSSTPPRSSRPSIRPGSASPIATTRSIASATWRRAGPRTAPMSAACSRSSAGRRPGSRRPPRTWCASRPRWPGCSRRRCSAAIPTTSTTASSALVWRRSPRASRVAATSRRSAWATSPRSTLSVDS